MCSLQPDPEPPDNTHMVFGKDTEFGQLRATIYRLRRAVMACAAVMMIGTFGFMGLEGWGFWHSLFFTLITITTVGYGDYGLSPDGERFTIFLLIGGLGVVTYSAGQIAQILIEDYGKATERRMNKKIAGMSDHFIVCGLGRIGQIVCRNLASARVPFVAIDRDPEAVAQASEAGWNAVAGDATDDETLERCGIERARGLTCVASSDTENIVITLSARGMNSDLFILSRAEHEDAVRKIQRAGASKVISPIRNGGISIANRITKPHLAAIVDGTDEATGIELAEVKIAEGSVLHGATVLDYGSAHEALVFVALQRNGEDDFHRPRADEMLNAGDVLVVAGNAQVIGELYDDASGLREAA